MASSTGTYTEVTAYPLNNFRFDVHIGGNLEGKSIPATSVSGPKVTVNTIDYRVGSDPQLTAKNMPGKPEPGSLSLKCLAFADGGNYASVSDFQEAVDAPYGGDFTGIEVTIDVLGMDGNINQIITCKGCVITSFSVSDLNSTGAEVWNVDLEIKYESMTVAAA